MLRPKCVYLFSKLVRMICDCGWKACRTEEWGRFVSWKTYLKVFKISLFKSLSLRLRLIMRGCRSVISILSREHGRFPGMPLFDCILTFLISSSCFFITHAMTSGFQIFVMQWNWHFCWTGGISSPLQWAVNQWLASWWRAEWQKDCIFLGEQIHVFMELELPQIFVLMHFSGR